MHIKSSGSTCVTGQRVCISLCMCVHAFKRISQRLNYFQTTVSAAWSWIPRNKSTNLVHQVKSDLRCDILAGALRCKRAAWTNSSDGSGSQRLSDWGVAALRKQSPLVHSVKITWNVCSIVLSLYFSYFTSISLPLLWLKACVSFCFSIFIFIQWSSLVWLIIQKSIDFQKTVGLALCLQPPPKMLCFSVRLKLMLCWTFQMFGRGQKQNRLWSGATGWIKSLTGGDLGEVFVLFVTSQSAKIEQNRTDF